MAEQRLDGRTRREQIVWAALRLAADGVANVTLKGVAEAVGVVPSALYRHFRNKESLMDAVMDHVVSRLVHRGREAEREEADALRAIEGVARFHMRLIVAEPGLLRLVFSEEGGTAARSGKILRAMARYRAVVAGLVRRGQAAGQIRADVDAEDLVYMYIGTVVPPALLYHLSGGAYALEDRFERNWRLFEDMARPRGGSGHAA
ncbi:MAG: TetR/AcrR family transcriptional regulator [Desulfovibrionaceae bacterium]